MPSLHVNMFSYYYVPIIRLVGTNLNKVVRLLRYSGLSSQNMYIKKKTVEKVLFFGFLSTNRHAEAGSDACRSILKIRKKQNKACFNSKKGSLS